MFSNMTYFCPRINVLLKTNRTVNLIIHSLTSIIKHLTLNSKRKSMWFNLFLSGVPSPIRGHMFTGLTSAFPSRRRADNSAANSSSSRTQDFMFLPRLMSLRGPAGHLALQGPIPQPHRVSSRSRVSWPLAQSTNC